MTVKSIPAKIEVICDACGGICGEGNVTRKQEGKLVIHRHALDWQGSPAADGTLTFDFCDACLGQVSAAINTAVTNLKTKPLTTNH